MPLSNLKGQYFQAAGTDPYVSVLYAWLAGMPDPSREGAKDQTCFQRTEYYEKYLTVLQNGLPVIRIGMRSATVTG